MLSDPLNGSAVPPLPHLIVRDVFWLRPGRPRPVPLVLGRVDAGFPSPASDFVEEALDLNDLILRNPPSNFMVRVAGRSMEGAGIHDGDLLVVDRSLEARHGDVVIAEVDGELTVKRLYRRRGRVGLVAEHEAYPPITMEDGMELLVWGVVTYVIRHVR